MISDQFAAAVVAARNSAALDQVARLLWRAHAEGALDDAAAEAVSGAVQARRAVFATKPPVSQSENASSRRRPVTPRSPDRQASLERRRRCALSGALPAAMAAAFTLGEIAALAVIAGQVRRSGACVLPIDAIAALAGVGRSTVQNALRQAARIGLIERQERRRAGQRSLTNILRIISPEWLSWLRFGGKGGGFKTSSTTKNKFISDADIVDAKGESLSPNGPSRGFMLRSPRLNFHENANAARYRKRLPRT